MEKLLYGLFCVVVVLGLVLGIDWLIWKLWTWVLPQLWPDGPAAIVSPGFWLFVGAWTLGSLILGGIRFTSKKD